MAAVLLVSCKNSNQVNSDMQTIGDNKNSDLSVINQTENLPVPSEEIAGNESLAQQMEGTWQLEHNQRTKDIFQADIIKVNAHEIAFVMKSLRGNTESVASILQGVAKIDGNNAIFENDNYQLLFVIAGDKLIIQTTGADDDFLNNSSHYTKGLINGTYKKVTADDNSKNDDFVIDESQIFNLIGEGTAKLTQLMSGYGDNPVVIRGHASMKEQFNTRGKVEDYLSPYWSKESIDKFFFCFFIEINGLCYMVYGDIGAYPDYNEGEITEIVDISKTKKHVSIKNKNIYNPEEDMITQFILLHENNRWVIKDTTAYGFNRYISADNKEYIFPWSDEIKVGNYDISRIDNRSLRLARNEILARHEYIFKNSELRIYFESMDWYKPNFSNELLNDIEKYNIEFIKEEEANRGHIN